MIIKTTITYGYMEKNKFHQKENGNICEIVSIFDNGSIKGYCKADNLSIKKETQSQINLNDNNLEGIYHPSNY